MTAPAEAKPVPEVAPLETNGEMPSGAALLLLPSAAEAARLALNGGEPPDSLHVTIWYGGDAVNYDQAYREQVMAAIDPAVASLPLVAEAMGAALFNPQANPATVLLCQADELTALRDAVAGALAATPHEQGLVDPLAAEHPSWLPHLTLSYDDRVADATSLVGPVTFDRLVLAWGADGGIDMTERNAAVVAAGAPEARMTETLAEAPPVVSALLDRWEGVLAPLEVASGDQRMISAAGFDVRPLPLPLRWQDEAWIGHDGAVVVGLIDTAELRTLSGPDAAAWDVADGTQVLWGAGPLDVAGDDGAEFARRLGDGYAGGVSIDMDNAEMEPRMPDGTPLPDLGPEIGEDIEFFLPDNVLMYATAWRLMAATCCATPAFAEARIRPATPVNVVAPVAPPVPVTPPSAPGPGATAALVASVWAAPPVEWFTDPGLPFPTPLTVTREGRILGHLAAWGTCHVGYKGKCVTPPETETDYAYFRTGLMACADGTEVPVGPLVMDIGHARPRGLSYEATLAHYSTGNIVGYVAAGEDEWGIWLSGTVAPDLDDATLARVKASVWSGDWRHIGEHPLELTSALVTTEAGFPLPRIGVDGDRQVSLVAAGVVLRRASVDVEDGLVAAGITMGTRRVPGLEGALVAAAATEVERRAHVRNRKERLASRIGRDRQSRAAAAAARIR